MQQAQVTDSLANEHQGYTYQNFVYYMSDSSRHTPAMRTSHGQS